MEIILVDDVFGLGRRGDVVSVANGYARNYLIPKKLAVPPQSGMIAAHRLITPIATEARAYSFAVCNSGSRVFGS